MVSSPLCIDALNYPSSVSLTMILWRIRYDTEFLLCFCYSVDMCVCKKLGSWSVFCQRVKKTVWGERKKLSVRLSFDRSTTASNLVPSRYVVESFSFSLKVPESNAPIIDNFVKHTGKRSGLF
jgi:hypothetical protein